MLASKRPLDVLPICPRARHGVVALMLGAQLVPSSAWSWSLSIAPAPRRLYLQVGDGTLGTSATVNTVSVSVPANQVRAGAGQPMSSDSTQARSPYDNYSVCSPPAQIFVAASYQRSSTADGPSAAILQVNSPPVLTSAGGDTIPFSQISWATSTLGSVDTTPNIIPPGTFNGATQTLANVPANRLIENCHTFFYANSVARPAGTYSGQVVYTISTP